MGNVVIIADQYQRYQETTRKGYEIDPYQEAQGMIRAAKSLGCPIRRIAIASQDDQEGIAAYQQAGFELQKVNGNRLDDIQKFIEQVSESPNALPQKHVILVSSDPAFKIFGNRIEQNEQTNVQVWSPDPDLAIQLTSLPAYSPHSFVDRTDEIELVMKRVRDLVKNRSAEKGAVIFTGTRGIGKSWLLDHLHHTELGSLSNAVTFQIDLEKYIDWDPVLAVADILTRFSAAVGRGRKGLGVTLADMSRNLIRHLQPILNHKVLVLLVDHVYESDWKLLAALEDYVLAPLTTEPGTLIVMAGRGRPYPWKTFKLRLEAEFVNLEPFDEAATREQLERQQKTVIPRAKEIHELGGGNPLANFLLAAYDDLSIAIELVIEGMLGLAVKKDFPQLRKYLQVLCVLRSFDEEFISQMLEADSNDENRKDQFGDQARRVRKELVKQSLARWEIERSGYTLDELLRKLLEHHLETVQPDRWRRLHQIAFELYQKRAQDYPRTSDHWRKEAQYHATYCRQTFTEHAPSNPYECQENKEESWKNKSPLLVFDLVPVS